MLTEDGNHFYVSYDEYHSLIEKLALRVHQSGWQFDTILCLARGGMRPGDILSRIFNKPLAIMSTSSYRAESGTIQGHLDIARFITTPRACLVLRLTILWNFCLQIRGSTSLSRRMTVLVLRSCSRNGVFSKNVEEKGEVRVAADKTLCYSRGLRCTGVLLQEVRRC